MPRPVARRRVHQSSGAVVRCPEQAGRPFRIVADSPRLHAGDPHKSSGNHTRVWWRARRVGVPAEADEGLARPPGARAPSWRR